MRGAAADVMGGVAHQIGRAIRGRRGAMIVGEKISARKFFFGDSEKFFRRADSMRVRTKFPKTFTEVPLSIGIHLGDVGKIRKI